MEFLIGSDPEVFAMKAGRFLSAFGLIPGTKDKPHKVRNGAVQVDGMALEFNIDPANSADVFIHNIKSVMAQLAEMVPDYELVATPVAHFGHEYIAEQPDEARDLGCNPDYNAWTGQENVKPDVKLPFRTAAGHVHIGWTENANVSDLDHFDTVCRVIKQLDFYLGLPSLVYDKDVERRSMYGKAGAFRVKPYGCEYRVLSNKWLSDESLMAWVFNATQKGLNDLLAGKYLPAVYGDIQEIINNSDVNAAMAIINDAGLEVPNVPVC